MKHPTIAKQRKAWEILARASYMLFKIKRVDERFSSMFKQSPGKRLTYKGVVLARIAMPEQSYLGKQFVKLYAAQPNKNKKPRASRAKRSSLSPAEKQQRNGTWKGHRE